MRKNRSNNGYIGNDETTPYTGVMSPSNITLDKSNEQVLVINPIELNYYNMTTSGGGYGATAYVGLTNGILLNPYIENYNSGGTGYVANTNRFIITGGGGPYVSGFVESVQNATVNSLALYRKIKSVDIVDPGDNLSLTPNITLGAGALNSSIVATISGFTLDVTSVSSGTVWPGSLLSGTGVASDTVITALGTGKGTTGTYTINNSQTLSSRSMTTSTTALGTCTLTNGKLTGISLTYPGLYTSVPVVSWALTPSDETAPSACVKMEDPTGYSSTPTVTFINPSSGSGSTAFGATATALIVYTIDNIGISSGGQEYSSSPSVNILQPNGSSKQTAVLSGNTISEIQFTKFEDAYYSSPPSIAVGGWKDLPSVTEGEDKFVGTYAIYNRDNYVAFKFNQNYTVDWGDGTTGSFTSGATASKIYSSAVFDGITQNLVNNQYKTVTITVTPNAGQRLNVANFDVKHPSLPVSTNFSTQWLNMKMAGSCLGTMAISSSSPNIRHYMLESFEFVGESNNTFSLATLLNGCVSLKRYEGKKLAKKVPTLTSMFQNCYALEYVSEMETDAATNMSSMFSSCHSLKTAPKLNTSKVTDFSSMFSNCYSLITVPLYDTALGINMSSMFSSCRLLKTVPLFNTIKVNNFSLMFNGCSRLTTVPCFSTKRATNMNGMFFGCSALKHVPLFDTSFVSNMGQMVQNCYSIVDFPPLKTSLVSNFGSMFSNCLSLINVPTLDTSSATSTANMFSGCYSLKTVPDFNMINVTDSSSMFSGCSNLIKVSNMNLPRVVNLTSMFSNCVSLKYVGNIYAPSCTNFSFLFNACRSLEYPPEIIVKGYQRSTTPQTLVFSNMFSDCSSLKSVPLFNTTFTTVGTQVSYSSMFSGCSSLTEIPSYDFSGSTGSANTSAFSSMFSTSYRISKINATKFAQSFVLPNPNMLGASALNELYANLETVGASGAGAKTITVTGSLGVATDSPNIATAKGWTVTG